MLIRCSEDIRSDPAELRRLVGEGFRGVDATDVEIHLRPVRHSRESFCGRAYPGRPVRARLDPQTRYLVVLLLPRLPRDRGYPRTYRYRGLKTAPAIRVDGWRENLVALAAHEACHIRQFRLGLRRSEVRAERWALGVLERFRSVATAPAAALPSYPPEQLALFAAG